MDILHALPGRNLEKNVEEELVQYCFETLVVEEEGGACNNLQPGRFDAVLGLVKLEVE